MKIFYTDHLHFPLPADHRFPIEKYSLLRQQLMQDEIVDGIKFCVPRAATDQEIVRAHTPGYFERMQKGEMTRKEMRRIGFPWSPELVERAMRSAGATIEAGLAAIKDNIAVSLAGGTHLAGNSRRDDTARFVDTGADREFLVGDTTDTRDQTPIDEGLDIDRRVLQQLDGHRDNL